MEKHENGYSHGTGGSMPYPGQSKNVQLAMVYSPAQEWQGVYAPDDALCHGTLFEALYKPLQGEG